MVLAMIFVIVATLSVVFWVYFALPIRRIKQLSQHIPGPNSVALWIDVTELLEYCKFCVKQYGPVVRVSHIGRVDIFVSDVADVEIILKDAEMINKPPIIKKFVNDWLGDGLLFSEGSYWRQQRKLITPTFHFSILEKFFEVFDEQGDILINVLKEKADGKTNLDIFDFIKAFALDVICETAMGTKMHSQTISVDTDYVTAVNEMQRILLERLYTPLHQSDFIFQFTKNGRTHRKSLQILNEKSDEIILQRKKYSFDLSTSNVSNIKDESSEYTKKRLVFIDLLLQAKNLDGTPLTNKQIREEVATFIFAGHDTTSTQLSLLCYILSKHPNVQEEIFKEQCTVLMNKNREPTFKEVQEMQYLERTIKESQRYFTVVSFLTRHVHKDITLKTNNYVVPKGAMLSIFVTSLHQNPKIYPNPEKFDPDRFLPENVQKREPFAFIPFSAGPRNCIGQKFAMLEMKLTVSKIIRNFKILPAYEEDGTPYEPIFKTYMVLTAVNGIKIRLIPRT